MLLPEQDAQKYRLPAGRWQPSYNKIFANKHKLLSKLFRLSNFQDYNLMKLFYKKKKSADKWYACKRVIFFLPHEKKHQSF